MGFNERVYGVVKKIPKGRVSAYREVAGALGNKNLARAVGNTLNKNKDKDVPCHRVVRSDGCAGGYRWGKRNKADLLRKEGLKIEKGWIDLKLFLFRF